jgi:hypothetical protein
MMNRQLLVRNVFAAILGSAFTVFYSAGASQAFQFSVGSSSASTPTSSQAELLQTEPSQKEQPSWMYSSPLQTADMQPTQEGAIDLWGWQEFSSALPTQDYVWIFQILGAAHDSSEWLAYSKNAFNFFSGGPTRADLMQQGSVVDTWDLDAAEVQAVRASADANQRSPGILSHVPSLRLSSTNAKTPKEDLDPEYTVMSSRSNSRANPTVSNAEMADNQRRGDSAGWSYVPTQEASDGDFPSLTVGVLTTMGCLVLLKEWLKRLLADG